MSNRQIPRRAVAVAAAALLGGAAVGWLTWPDRSPGAGNLPAVASAPATPKQPPESTSARAPGRGVSLAPAVPTRLRIPALDLALPVQPKGVDPDGGMALPKTVSAVAWYRYGPRPGSTSGATVLSGHLDTVKEGVGPMSGLVRLETGDEIAVEAGSHTVTYAVASVSTIDRSDLDLERLFARDGPPRLHLVTCGGDYVPDAGGYQANVVVVAKPIQPQEDR